MKFHLGHLLGLSAIIVAGCAAFFSVYGLGQLFAGASLAVIIMASALEFSKLVAATFLHRYWSSISKVLRVYLTIGVVVLVTITSAGIYGFLSNAYQKTAFGLSVYEGEVGLVDGKIKLFERSLETNTNNIDSKNSRITQLSDLRTQQEVRLDSMINRRYFSNANDTRAEIKNANTEIQNLTSEVDVLVQTNNSLNDSIGKYEIMKLEMQSNSDVAAEVGPLKYLAELTGQPMDVIVNYFILLLIFVFDPLAISLVIATSWLFVNRKKALSDGTVEDSKGLGEALKEAREVIENVNEDEEVENVHQSSVDSVEVIKRAREVIKKVEEDEKLRKLRERYLDEEWDSDAHKGTKKYEEPTTNIDAGAELTRILQEEIDKAVEEEWKKNVQPENEIIDCEFEGDDDTQGDINATMEEISNDVKEKLAEEKPEPVVEEKPVKKPFTPEEIETIKKNKMTPTPKPANKVERIGSNKYLDDGKVYFKK